MVNKANACLSVLSLALLVGCNDTSSSGSGETGSSGGSGETGSDTTITVVSWGGTYSESQNKAYHLPYQQLNPDVTIKLESAGRQALSRLRTGEDSWDLVDMTLRDAKRACEEDLVIPIEHDQVLAPAPDGGLATDDFFASSLSDCGVPQIAYSMVVAYNTDAYTLSSRPDSVNDFFDSTTFPGNRAIADDPEEGILELALYADGIAPGEVYQVLATEAGVDRAFEKLNTIKSEIVFTSGGEAIQQLVEKEVAFALTVSGRVFNASELEGKPLEIIWDGQLVQWAVWVVPENANQAVVFDYLYWATDTQRLADQAQYIPYGPARASSTALVGTHETLNIDMKPHMPTEPLNYGTAIAVDSDFWDEYGSSIQQRFDDWK